MSDECERWIMGIVAESTDAFGEFPLKIYVSYDRFFALAENFRSQGFSVSDNAVSLGVRKTSVEGSELLEADEFTFLKPIPPTPESRRWFHRNKIDRETPPPRYELKPKDLSLTIHENYMYIQKGDLRDATTRSEVGEFVQRCTTDRCMRCGNNLRKYDPCDSRIPTYNQNFCQSCAEVLGIEDWFVGNVETSFQDLFSRLSR